MMTPRSRKPVVMLSSSNLCNLPSIEDNKNDKMSKKNYYQVIDIDIDDKNIEIQSTNNQQQHCPPHIDDDYSTMSITNTFREYLLSRSVLTASPVDLSFSSRTGDFEQSEESDLIMPNDDEITESLLDCLDGNNPDSDISGSTTNDENNITATTTTIDNNKATSPRKRGTNLQRNDSKKSIKNNEIIEEEEEEKNIQRQFSKSSIDSESMKENFQETSF